MTKSIVLIGAGNVAHSLGHALVDKGFSVVQIYSRKLHNATALAEKVNAQPVDDLSAITKEADLYLICTPDNSISEIAQQLQLNNKVIAHTSGAVEIEVLINSTDNYGVFYPLQTFTKNKALPFSNIPICIEANNDNTKNILLEVANSISNNVHKINSEQRKTIHLSAVFANNFTNHLLSISENLLQEKNIPTEIIQPLIEETFNKLQKNSPSEIQTGPAKRGDSTTLKKHLELLKNHPQYQKIYTLVSESIQKQHVE